MAIFQQPEAFALKTPGLKRPEHCRARVVRSVVDEALTSEAEPRATGTTPHPGLIQNNARALNECGLFILYGKRTPGSYFLAALYCTVIFTDVSSASPLVFTM